MVHTYIRNQRAPYDNISIETSPIINMTSIRGKIDQTYQLEITANNKIIIPGQEPTSAVSAPKISPYNPVRHDYNVMVDYKDVLEAIPGSYIKYGMNFNKGSRQKWIVFPPSNYDCPCEPRKDYYQILSTLPCTTPSVAEEYDRCDMLGMGYCPSPDFEQEGACPTPQPYVREDCPTPCPKGPVGPVGPPGPPGDTVTKLDQLIDVVAPQPVEGSGLRYIDGVWRDVPNIVDGGEF